MHTIDNVGIFVLLPVRINWEQLPVESILVQIYICLDALNWNSDDWWLYPSPFQS